MIHFTLCFVLSLHKTCWHGPFHSHLESLHRALPPCPWLLLGLRLSVSPNQLHFGLSVPVRAPVAHSLRPEPEDRWATAPLTVITDPFPSHYLAPDLPLPRPPEHGAIFLQCRVQEVIMIPVHYVFGPSCATSNSQSQDSFISPPSSFTVLFLCPICFNILF